MIDFMAEVETNDCPGEEEKTALLSWLQSAVIAETTPTQAEVINAAQEALKTDELRQEVRELELDIKRLLNKFIQRNGVCDFKITAEVGITETEDGTSFPVTTVSVSVTI